MSKEDLRQTYDVCERGLTASLSSAIANQNKGTIFWKIKEAREQGRGWNKGFGLRELKALLRTQTKTYLI